MKYRSEIDGMRALAVLPVVANHLNPKVLIGGAAGVDVFFVISGFLISQIILTDISNGTFTFSNFYSKRVRRIFPLLIFVLILTIAVGWFVLLPSDFADLSSSAAAAAFSVSNLHFFSKVSYFAESSQLNPLLHTWSLGVEEQFYLLFPLIVYAVWCCSTAKRFTFNLSASFGTILIVSLLLSIWGAENKPDKNFFFTFSRFWELIAGALAGIAFQKGLRPPEMWSNGLSVLGLLMLTGTYVFLGPEYPFPSMWTVIPVVATILLLCTADLGTFVGSLLRLRLLVLIGTISYSIYLIHQPLFAFVRLTNLSNSQIYLAICTLSLLPLSWLSWRFIEQPFRTPRRHKPKLGKLITAALLTVGVTTALIAQNRPLTPAYSRLTTNQQAIEVFIGSTLDKTDLYLHGKCFVDHPFPDPEACILGGTGNNLVLIWGDSHAAGLAVGLRELLPNVATFSIMRCPVFVETYENIKSNCKTPNLQTLEQIKLRQPSTVVLHRNWLSVPHEAKQLEATIKTIRTISPDTQILIVGGVPQWQGTLPIRLLQGAGKITNGMMLDNKFQAVLKTDEILKRLSVDKNVHFFSVISALCAESKCLATAEALDGSLEPTAFDYGHLTKAGSLVLSRMIIAQSVFKER